MIYPIMLRTLVLSLLFSIAACSDLGPPNEEILQSALKEPLLNSLKYGRSRLPREAFDMKGMEVLVTEFSENKGIRRVNTAGSILIELSLDGSKIQDMIMAEGSISSALATQDFVRAGGFMLRKGESLEYKFNADLIETSEGDWRIIRGRTQLEE